MAKNSFAATAGVVLIVAALIGLGARLQQLREVRYPPAAEIRESLDITSGALLKRLSVGYSALAADLYWIRAIQYYGGIKLRTDGNARDAGQGSTDYELLYPMLDLTTTLDPRFNIAYRFGAIFLAERYPAGAGRPDLAQALLEKGLRERPDKWEYMQDIGFVHYWWRHDYRTAAQWFERASSVPGAPWFLRSLAATTLAQGGDRQSSRVMWEAIRESAENDWLRSDAERHLLQLSALDQIDDLQKKIDARVRNGAQPPASWLALIETGVFPGVPVDPTGTPYEIERGRVRLGERSSLFPLPDDPQRNSVQPS
jgi:hypothetical protein